MGGGMKRVELYGQVRRAVYVEGMSRREAARRFGIDPRTVAKMLAFSVPPGYRRSRPPARPKLDPFVGIIDRILEEDKGQPAKQQHTAKRIFERLRDEHGYGGGITIVRGYVHEQRQRLREMFVPLRHDPGHAQVDFGEALAVIAGEERKIHFFAMDLPHSDACLVQAYPAESSEAFCEGHNVSFEFFGGVPRSILYDNTKLAVARILGDGTRQRTEVFSELQSHYLFADRFGRPGKGNDKGKVEGLVGYARRNFMVPIPHAASFAELNAYLLECCRRRLNDRLRGHDETIGERLVRDREALLPLPPAPYDACEKKAARVSSLSLVRYRGNDYSVPTAYGHREVLVRGYVHEVVIACGGGGDRPSSAFLRARGLRLQPLALPGPAGTEDRRARPGRAAGRLGTARGVRDPAPAARGAHGQARQAGVRPGPALAGGVPPRRCAGRSQRSDRAWRDRLRCGQASGAVPHRTAPAAAEP